MNAIIVDDEQLVLEALVNTAKHTGRFQSVCGFCNATQVVEHLRNHMVDIAFLDIELQGSNGLALAKNIKEMRPTCMIVFVSGYTRYAVDAFQLRPMNYLIKPVSEQDMIEELDYIENLPACFQKKNSFYIQCFGNFEVFIHGIPAKFRYRKTRELLAILIDHKGKACTNKELISILWEDHPDTSSLRSQLRNMFTDLKDILDQAGKKDSLLKHRNYAMIKINEIECDYYQYLNKDSAGINLYMGEYMAQYSWAEMTNGSLWLKDKE